MTTRPKRRPAGRWRIVAPFCKPLLGWLALDTRIRDGSLQSHCAGVVLTLRMISVPDEQRRLRDALELLHTLWRLDPREWGLALTHGAHLQLSGARLEHDDRETAPHVVLSFKHNSYSFRLRAAQWQELLTSATMSDEAAQAKKLLLEKYGVSTLSPLGVGNAAVSIALRLEFLVFSVATSEVDAFVSQIVVVVKEIQASLRHYRADAEARSSQAMSCTKAYTPFELASVDLDPSSIHMTVTIARQLERLHALNVPLRLVKLRMSSAISVTRSLPADIDNRLFSPPIQPADKLSGANIDQLVSASEQPSKGLSAAACDRLFSTLMQPENGQETPRPLAAETVAIDRADPAAFATMCSILARPTLVKNLQLYSAFTFDTDAYRRFKWQWLTYALCSRVSETTVKHLALTEFELKLADVEAVASALSTTALPRSSCSQNALQPTGCSRAGLESLALSCEASNGSTLEAIPALIELIGQQLQSLSVYMWVGEQSTHMVCDYLASCRHLRLLDLFSVELESMDVIADAYVHRDCRIESLALHFCRVSSASLTRFIKTLSDDRHKPSRVLRELCLDRCGTDSALDESNLTALKEMLKANRLLEFLDVCVEEPLLSVFHDRLLVHNQESLPSRATPLSMLCKAAFLSTVRQYSRDRESEPLGVAVAREALDMHVVALIFRFAATRMRRTVTVEDS